jgi:hypothetical protein
MNNKKVIRSIFMGFVYVLLMSFFGCQEEKSIADFISQTGQSVKAFSFLIK